jgi:hypothetical protein
MIFSICKNVSISACAKNAAPEERQMTSFGPDPGGGFCNEKKSNIVFAGFGTGIVPAACPGLRRRRSEDLQHQFSRHEIPQLCKNI